MGRVVRDDGSLLEKLPGEVTEQAKRLMDEGHVVSGRKRLRVADFEESLARL